MSCFKAYDIRGVLGDELNDDVAYRIGRAFAQHLRPKVVVLGSDVRLSSESLKLSIANGLMDEGVDVLDLGMVGTEEVYFATWFLQASGGIEVTASHNPMNYNGMKLVCEEAKPISGDTGLREIEKLVALNDFGVVNAKRGRAKKKSVLNEYISHLFTFIDTSNFVHPLKIVVNVGNGAAGHVIDEIEHRFSMMKLPIELIKVFNEPDGNFPHGIPNPLLHERRQDTQDAMVKHKADLGVAFDGDFDRCFFFDHTGQFVEGYYIVGLLAEVFLLKDPNEKIIHDPRLIWNTQSIVEELGGEAIMCKTGHAFIKERMRAENAVYGGEMSAHHYFRDFAYCDSGMIPWLMIVELLSIKKKSLLELVSNAMQKFPSPGELNFKINDAESVIDNICKWYKNQAISINDLDGLSMTFENWRFNLRSSNTEPYVRLNLETRGKKELLTEKLSEVQMLLKQK